jgi:hypothetical protein
MSLTFDEMGAALHARHEALPPAARAELLHVLMLPDFERADRMVSSGAIRKAASSPSC